MAFLRLEDFDPNYRHRLGGDIQSFTVYTDSNQKIGQVVDAWVDEIGNIQNLTVEVGSHPSGKQVMMPFDQARVDRQNQRIYMQGLPQAQVDSYLAANRAIETHPPQERPSPAVPRSLHQPMAALEDSAPLEAPRVRGVAASPPPAQPSVSPHRQELEPPAPLEQFDRPSEQPRVIAEEIIPLKEERLVVDKHKQKTGEVIIRKEIATEMIQVPVQREKLIVEQAGNNPKQLAEIDLQDGQQL